MISPSLILSESFSSNEILKQSGDEDGSQGISAECRGNIGRRVAAQCGYRG